MSYLELQNLKKVYNDHSVGVKSVSMNVEKGEFITFLGPSGSGKTTTLSMVAGFVEPTEGAVLVEGKDITHVAPRKRNFGMVFQDYSLFPHMTVEENISFPLEMRGESKDSNTRKVRDALALVGLERFAKRFSGQLSGGQQQRVAIARAIVYRPSILLMDEPLGALDRLLRDRMQIEIKHIQKELGITTLYVTHDQTEALTMSDRICVFNHGGIVQSGRPSEIYERPESRFVAEFIGESNFFQARCESVDESDQGYIHNVTLKTGATMSITSPSQYPAAEDVLIVLRPEHIAVCRGNEETERRRAAGEGILEGRIVDSIYQGSTLTLEIDIAKDTRIFARVPPKTEAHRNERIRVALDSSKAVLLPVAD